MTALSVEGPLDTCSVGASCGGHWRASQERAAARRRERPRPPGGGSRWAGPGRGGTRARAFQQPVRVHTGVFARREGDRPTCLPCRSPSHPRLRPPWWTPRVCPSTWYMSRRGRLLQGPGKRSSEQNEGSGEGTQRDLPLRGRNDCHGGGDGCSFRMLFECRGRMCSGPPGGALDPFYCLPIQS